MGPYHSLQLWAEISCLHLIVFGAFQPFSNLGPKSNTGLGELANRLSADNIFLPKVVNYGTLPYLRLWAEMLRGIGDRGFEGDWGWR